MEQKSHLAAMHGMAWHGLVSLPPSQWKNPQSWLVGSVIPSSHKGHICEWCLLGFHTKEPQQASINGGRLLSCAVMLCTVPLCRSDGWVKKNKTLVLCSPTIHLIWVYPKSQKHFPIYPSCYRAMHMVCFICWGFDFWLWDFCHYHNTIGLNGIAIEG